MKFEDIARKMAIMGECNNKYKMNWPTFNIVDAMQYEKTTLKEINYNLIIEISLIVSKKMMRCSLFTGKSFVRS